MLKNRLKIALVALLACLFANANADPLPVKVATWNIRINIKKDSLEGNIWSYRRDAIVKIVQSNDIDILGVQEDYKKELNELNSRLDEYRRVGFPNHENGRLGSFNSIFFKQDRFEVLDSGMFYLAEDDTKPVLGWNGAYIRSCTWVKFGIRRRQAVFWVFNAHGDYAGGEVERESSKLLIQKIKDIAGESSNVILMGDMNFNQKSDGYEILNSSNVVRDGYHLAEQKKSTGGTFNRFKKDYVSDERLDHVFVTKPVRVLEYEILLDKYEKDGEQRFPSDHYPVILKLDL